MNSLSTIGRLLGVFLTIAVIATVAAPLYAAEFICDGNHVICGQARFDVLAPTVIRMQYAPGGFVDVPTAVVTNRDMADRAFTVTSKAGWVEIKTARMSLMYLVGSGKFTSDNLRIVWSNNRKAGKWNPGSVDNQNLGGPFSSFNEIIVSTEEGKTLPEFPNGMLGRSGYYVLDDSATPVWDESSDWITPRNDKNAQDWYFFAYGTDYREFYKQYTKLAGRIPMVPRYALGSWMTDLNFEYFGQSVTQDYIFSIVDRFRKENIPLDVFVLDYGWHLYGWDGSLDWSPIFPDPKAFLKKMHGYGLRVTPNDHPAKLSFIDTRARAAAEQLDLNIMHNISDISRDWKFRIDPSDLGQDKEWFSITHRDDDWFVMKNPSIWEGVGFQSYDGIGWYRKWVEIPKEMENGPVHIGFGGVDDQYDLYINGKLTAHHGGLGNSCVDKLTDTDITPYIHAGKNLVCLRVTDDGGNGGFTGFPIAISSDKVEKVGVSFDFASKEHAKLWMDFHNKLVDEGVDFWWIDGAANASMPGLNPQMWTNKVYYDFQEQHTDQRSFVFSRYGGPGSHRYPGYFTGDCNSNWKVLNYEIPYTLKAGNVLCPYVTHDIGGFIGSLHNQFELYARWVQFGALSPILRLHSDCENPELGNARLPWNYGQQGIDLCREFFQLRYRLIPYLYTYCRATYDTGLPLLRPLYLEYPNSDQSYRFDNEYFIGKEMLVAPITRPGTNGVAVRDIYLPPGSWTDYFTGKIYAGSQIISYECPLERMPIFIKQGSIIPMQPDMAYSSQKPLDPLIMDVYTGGSGSLKLYEDDGLSLDYKQGKCAWTPLILREKNGQTKITVGPASGTFYGQVKNRGYLVNVHCPGKPSAVIVDGKGLPKSGWKWDAAKNVATISVKTRPVTKSLVIMLRFADNIIP